MRESKQKSRTFRRVQRRTPGGKTVTHYVPRALGPALCGACGIVLKGIPRGTAAQFASLSKTQKRPERPYGGVLCTVCSRLLVKQQTRTSAVAKNLSR